MAISADGKEVIVSASTGNVGQVIDTTSGKIINEFESGDSPHETNYSADGERLFHAAIGRVYTPTDEAQLDTRRARPSSRSSTPTRWRSSSGSTWARSSPGRLPGMSDAVRPMALSPDERYLYFQVSFFHGFVEYDFKTGQGDARGEPPDRRGRRRTSRRRTTCSTPPTTGSRSNPPGKRLCVAGTMSDYAAIVSRKTFKYKILEVGPKPYWSTNSANGKHCYVSVSGSDRVAVISYKKRKEVASIPVGDHPQRVRTGRIVDAYLRD